MDLSQLKVPTPPPTPTPTSTPTPGTSRTGDRSDTGSGSSRSASASSEKRKRQYNKAELTKAQETELMEWYRENDVLYNRRHEHSNNSRHKDLLKAEQAEKMGITGKYNII